MRLSNKKSGFTLIELLVVISIISLLSSVALTGLSRARAKARDSKKVQTMIQLRTAAELFRASNANASYPTTIVELKSFMSDPNLDVGMFVYFPSTATFLASFRCGTSPISYLLYAPSGTMETSVNLPVLTSSTGAPFVPALYCITY